MHIGNFLDNQISKNITYSYHHRGLPALYLPDSKPESEEKEVYTKENGNLFFNDAVSWNDTVIFQDGVDIRIDLAGKSFVDHIYLEQGQGAALVNAEIFTIADGKFKKIGHYEPETGLLLTSHEITISVGTYCDNIVVRLNADCMPVIIQKLQVWGAWDLENAVWPTPSKASYSEDVFPLESLKTIQAVTEDEKFAAQYLCEKLKENTGYAPVISETEGELVLHANTVEKNELCKDAFTLNILKDHGQITASNRRSLLYAADALLQRIDKATIRCCYIEDEAFADFRGVHFAIPSKKNVAFLKNMIKYVFVPMRYNQIILQVSGAMKYDKYPEINAAWINACEKYENGEWPMPFHYGFISRDIWQKEEVRELLDYIESFGLEVIPEVQSWAHTQYITMAFPELAEKIAVKKETQALHLSEDDALPNEFYHHCMCPSHSDYYNVIFNILDEVLEVFKPKRFVHMGHDEIYNLGQCSKCSQIPRGDLFATEVTQLNDYIKKYNLTMIIWSDMLHSQRIHATATAINKVPKDIIMMDFVWYFHLDENLEENLLNHGFQVIMGNMYSSHYPRYESRSHKKGILGGEVSTWVECSELSYAYEGKIFDFIYSAELLWNTYYRSDMRLTYNELIKPVIANVRKRIGNLSCAAPEKHISVSGTREAVPFDIRDIISYSSAVAVNVYAPNAEIAIHEKAEIITFTHATDMVSERITWSAPFKIGEYVICYDDGTTYTEDLLYAANIYKYRAPFGDRMQSAFFRHEGYVGTYLTIPECGKTSSGDDYTLGKYSIRNPYPEKMITTVKVNHSGNTAAAILLFHITLQ